MQSSRIDNVIGAGLGMGRRLGLTMTAIVVAACSGGASAAPAGTAPVTVPAPQPVLDIVQQTTFDPSLDVHLDQMARRASGLYVRNLVLGTGTPALKGRTAVVRYTGWLPSGKQFDSGEISVTLGSNRTIAAWEEGVLGMRVGGKRRLIVPPSLGYGASGSGAIPPNSVLVFDMEVTEVM